MKKKAFITQLEIDPTDFFTFDIGKDDTNKDYINYQVLEQIKDGRFVAAKFRRKKIKICKPNIVILLSNEKPEVEKLAMDR